MTTTRAFPRDPSTLESARRFCSEAPYRDLPYSKRNWGGVLHSLCSYQGKLKPSIAHFLVSWFTSPGDRVLDPMAGVGTIPLEARRQGRVGIANDLSPLAGSISTAKLAPFTRDEIAELYGQLATAVVDGPSLEALAETVDVDFGLNGPIREYFHPDTLREILIARSFFGTVSTPDTAAKEVLRSAVLHMLHGNRPYALSRRSHPVTPFSPSGPFQYRSLLDHLSVRLAKVVPELLDLHERTPPGRSLIGDFRSIDEHAVDAVITSPPFVNSLRFWSSNWMRLWFAGWEPSDFASEPSRYLETEQRSSYEVYREFGDAMHEVLKPGGLLIMHLGETATANMAESIIPFVQPSFDVFHVGREDVEDTESHGLRDKGATVAHWYLFARRR